MSINSPLEIIELDIPKLNAGQALVEITYSGICHTQLSEVRGKRGVDEYLPHCLGHEASGVVLEVGSDVTKVKAGDSVIASWLKGSGANVPGTKYKWGNKTVNAGAITTFMHHAIISENRLTKKPEQVSMLEAALIGCAIPTGAGMVFNTARVQQGQSVAVFGVGGIGLMAINAAAIAGATPIIAIDIVANKLETAIAMGATHTILSANTITSIREICPNGVDFAIEATGNVGVMRMALESVKPQGGKAVIAGNAPFDSSLTINPQWLNAGKSILGTWGGDSSPDRDYPKFAELLATKQLNIAHVLAKPYSLEHVNAALTDLECGKAIRPIISMK